MPSPFSTGTTGTISFSVDVTVHFPIQSQLDYTDYPSVLNSFDVPITISRSVDISGCKVAQISHGWTIAEPFSVTYDLLANTLVDGAVECVDRSYGFASIIELILLNDSSSPINLDGTISNSVRFLNSEIYVVPPGGCYRFTSSMSNYSGALDSSHRLFGINSDDEHCTYRMLIIGEA